MYDQGFIRGGGQGPPSPPWILIAPPWSFGGGGGNIDQSLLVKLESQWGIYSTVCTTIHSADRNRETDVCKGAECWGTLLSAFR